MTTLHLLHAGAALKSYTEAIGARIHLGFSSGWGRAAELIPQSGTRR
jgi:hypothetical protein